MDENTEMYYALVKGNAGQWIFPVETKPSSAYLMRDDGIQIFRLESEFVRTHTMKLYGISVQGNTKTWVLPCLLEPETIQSIQNGGIVIDELVYRNIGIDEVVDEKLEEKVINKKSKRRVSK